MSELFAEATRSKYRFQSSKGLLSTEDLWDLGKPALNTIYVALQKQIAGESGLMVSPTSADTELRKKMEVVKTIFEYKQAAAERAEEAEKKRTQREQIASIIADKKNEVFKAMSIEELEGLLK